MIDVERLLVASKDEIDVAIAVLNKQRARLGRIEHIPRELEDLQVEYALVVGVRDGTAYRDPLGAHDAVPPDETRVFEGRLWKNVSGRFLAHSPLVDPGSWEDLGPAEAVVPDPSDYPEWNPSGVYKKDAVFSWGGRVWRVNQDHTAQPHFTPDIVASLYTEV